MTARDDAARMEARPGMAVNLTELQSQLTALTDRAEQAERELNCHGCSGSGGNGDTGPCPVCGGNGYSREINEALAAAREAGAAEYAASMDAERAGWAAKVESVRREAFEEALGIKMDCTEPSGDYESYNNGWVNGVAAYRAAIRARASRREG